MAIYTQSTMDFDASSAIQSQYQAGVGPIVQPYITAGFTEPIPTWTPPLPDGTYPAPSGQYQNHRSWTDLTQAQQCANQVNAWLDSNPECKAFNTTGPIVVQE
jgi:hypothetical protein